MEADVFQFRLLIETFTARLAATTITAEQIIELYRNDEAMKASIRASDLEASARIDAAFHASIIAWSGNNLLAEIYTTTEGIIVESHRLPLLARHRLWEQPIDEHVDVLKAFEQHDPEGSGYYMRLHLVRTAGRSGVETRLDNI